MSFWIFKIAKSSTYPDVRDQAYVFDNTHSVRVQGGDEFLYLEKGARTYAISGAGRVKRVTSRAPIAHERRNDRVTRVFTAHLDNVVTFAPPLDISRQTAAGRRNRLHLGLPVDMNSIGWSLSMRRVTRELFVTLIDAALQRSVLGTAKEGSREGVDDDSRTWHIDDRMALVSVRGRLERFRRRVLKRHRHTCVVCGTRLRVALEAAHIRSYSADPTNRANPSNGICLCRYCHAAFDADEILLLPDGSLLVVNLHNELDEVARRHFFSVISSERKEWLRGVNPLFLEERSRAARTGRT